MAGLWRHERATGESSPHRWACFVFAAADLGDMRLRRRVQTVAAALAAHPRDSLPQACGQWSATKGAYRLLAHERVTPQALGGAVGQATAQACGGREAVACVQDTTTLSLPRARQMQGLGPVTNVDVAGVLVHSTLAVGLEGQVIGLLGQATWSRTRREGPKPRSRDRPLADKESRKWLGGIAAARQAFDGQARRPRLIHIFDREGDVHEVLAEIVGAGEGAVIRSAQSRRVSDASGQIAHAHALVAKAPVLAQATVEIGRRSGRRARRATVEVRALAVSLAPNRSLYPGRAPLVLGLVEVREPAPPEGAEPVLWRLWATEPIETAEQVLRVVGLYGLRWRIEEVHLVLKSGCRVEDLRLSSVERLAKALVLYSAVAVRVVQLRDFARLSPRASAACVLSDAEWRVLWARRHGRGPPAKARPPRAGQALAWIGRLGGHLGRAGDGPPGVRTLWRGLRDLQLLAEGYRLREHTR